jgi:hypothetical protein
LTLPYFCHCQMFQAHMYFLPQSWSHSFPQEALAPVVGE